MNKVNRLVIGTLPYAVLICFILVNWINANYYFILGAVCVVLFIANLFTNKTFVIHNYTFFILLFGVYMILSNVYIAQNKFIPYNELFKNQFIYAFFVLNIIENTTFTKRQISRWIRAFEVTVWVTLVVILIQQFYDVNFLRNKTAMDTIFEQSIVSQSENRLISIFSWSGILDLIFYFVPITFFLINYELNHNRINKAYMYIIVLFIVCVLSKSRSCMIAAVPVVIIFQYSHNKRIAGNRHNRTVLILLFFFISYFTVTEIPFFKNILKDRILETSKGNLENRSMNTRLLAFEAFAKCFPDQPVLGAGNTKYASGAKGLWNYKLASFLAGRSAQIHVGFLDLFYLYGLVGGSLYVIFLFIAVKKVYVKTKIYNFRSPFWALMTIPIANLGIVSFNVMSAGLLLSFVLTRNLEVFCEKPSFARTKNLPNESETSPSEAEYLSKPPIGV